jgi:hypothetical protein
MCATERVIDFADGGTPLEIKSTMGVQLDSRLVKNEEGIPTGTKRHGFHDLASNLSRPQLSEEPVDPEQRR